MPNPYVNKVKLADGTTLIDISDSTAVASDVAQGKYFYLPSGQKVEGASSGGGVDGDDLAYGLSTIGSAVIGSSVIS